MESNKGYSAESVRRTNELNLERDRQQERRKFITGLISVPIYAQAIATKALMGSEADMDQATIKKYDNELEILKKTETKTNSLDYNFTNSERSSVNGNTLRNLGVQHSKKSFEKNARYILEALNAADVVLLEHTSGDYFNDIARYAKDKVKSVYNIDDDSYRRQKIGVFASYGSAIGAFVAGQTKDKLAEKEVLKYVYGSLLAVSQIGILPPSLIVSIFARKKNIPGVLHSTHLDFSYTGDARTIFMYDNVQRVLKIKKDKKILIITGDVHAESLEYYFDHPVQAQRKHTLYKVLYGLMREASKND